MTKTTSQRARIRELMLINLVAVFGERDPERRQRAIAANYTQDVLWSDPEATTRGHEEINEGAQKLLDGNPDFVFAAAVPIHVLRDVDYLPFTFGATQQPPASIGCDLARYEMGG
jgi:hypothetical protein